MQEHVKQNRLPQLDSIRGLAALSVVLYHCRTIPSALDGTVADSLLRHTPLAMFVAGQEAVLFFFVLSGFVLALPFLRGTVSYPQFAIKRICRIYLPYYAAMLLAVAALLTWRGGSPPSLGPAVDNTWDTPCTPSLIAQYALLIFYIPTPTLNGPIWSLVHEMRISLVFPLIAPLVVRGNWKALGIAMLLALAGTLVIRFFFHGCNYHRSVYYTSFFIAGCLLAKHRAALTEAVGRLSRRRRLGLFLCAVILYTLRFWLRLPYSPPGYPNLSDGTAAAGASIFIILALASGSFAGFLQWRPIHFVGQMSYSVYLVHAPLLIAFVNLFYHELPVWSIWLLTITGTLLVSSLMYYAVEIPSISAGRHLAKQLAPRPHTRVEGTPSQPPA